MIFSIQLSNSNKSMGKVFSREVTGIGNNICMKPMVVRIVNITRRVCSAGTPTPNGEARAMPFPVRERTQAAKMSRNLESTKR